jgi:hypothetical protein
MRNAMRLALLACAALAGGCGSGVDSDEAAEAAYLGLDNAVAKSLALGFDGFNAASSANIPDQMTTGDVTGTLTVSGQVDQGESANKGMRLLLTMVDYQDVPETDETLLVVYDTDPTALPMLDLQLRSIPDGTLSGTLVGDFIMEGDIDGVVTLNLTITGELMPNPEVPDTGALRVPGTTRVTGTATSEYGTYNVDITI